MNIILFDTPSRKKLFPLTLTRAVADLRMGIVTIKERWEKMSGRQAFVLTDTYLQSSYINTPSGEYFFVDACVIPSLELINTISALKANEAIKDHNGLIAGRAVINAAPSINHLSSLFKQVSSIPPVQRIVFPFDLLLLNQQMIESDFTLFTKGRISNDTNDTVHITKVSRIFIEEGALIDHAVLNASTGPIYISKNATIMEGCFIRGPFVLGEGAVLKMGAKVYGATTIGPHSMGGGEIKNSIITGYSNKAHDGYLGDSVIGEWCNLGAGTSNSNLKNTGGIVQLWNYDLNGYVPAGNKCGVIMGDYSRTAINSSINTGSVIGVCSNVFGTGLLPKFIPDFTWGSDAACSYKLEKAITDISNWKKMKNKTIGEQETQVLKHIFETFR
ncbi:putative sugar nucleotidyl transferase [Segetibacter sp.]|jgi:UDP-N-acetylglucosamine diphosphorylase/glucosamine-1-phosphate N-acetyltransferase|uniref:putative sugar nucleotidyl transferase n=1 Tax=Segetibacter sp. TaxID=2231182 RepID=UPI00263145E6|nr:putative sugar nucleotidyl transferase [Segetibacter sp.]MCW3079534.1 glucose-phosphate thymidylyltransferase [Segetibacter sp.]